MSEVGGVDAKILERIGQGESTLGVYGWESVRSGGAGSAG
jgi:hypothetical protein